MFHRKPRTLFSLLILSLSAAAHSQSYSTTVLADHPIAYWRLGETSGTAAVDSSPNGRTGTYTGGVTLGQAGALIGDTDLAALFDGTSGYVSISNDGLAFFNNFTLEAWVKPSDLMGTQRFFSNRTNTAGADGYGFGFSGGTLFFTTFGIQDFSGSTSLAKNIYSHVVVTFDSNDIVSFYINGVLDSTIFSFTGAHTSNSPNFTLGANPIADGTGSHEYFHGVIDEAAVYDTVLSPDQIMAHYITGHPPLPPTAPTNLTALAPGAGVNLSWTASTNATSHNVYRSTTSGSGYSQIASGIAATTYDDTTTVSGTTYYYVVTGVNSTGESPYSNEASATPKTPLTGNGDGLTGNYYFGDDVDFSPLSGTPFQTEVDPIINFDNSGPTPQNFNAFAFDAGVPSDDFTAEWTGLFQSPITGPITFSTVADDGIRLYVDGNLLINNPNYQPATRRDSAPVNMIAGQYYSITVDYFQGGGGAVAELLYAYPGLPIGPIPQSQLYSMAGPSVTGTVALEGVNDLTTISAGAPLGTFHVSFRTPGTTTEVYGADVTLTPVGAGSPNGTFSISGVPAGTYDVAIKGHKSLRVAVATNLAINGSVTLPDALLPAGDATDDNHTDIGDFGIMVNSYELNYDPNDPNSGYDPRADFNYDGLVNIGDFGLLVNEFGIDGAP